MTRLADSWKKPWTWRKRKRWGVLKIGKSPSDNHEPLQSLPSLPSGICGAAGFETGNCLALWVCWLPEKGAERRNMPGEERQRRTAEVWLAGYLGWLPFCRLPGRAEAGGGGVAGRMCLWYRRLHRGVAPVYRSPLLSAFDGSAFAEGPGAPPVSGRCSVGPERAQLRLMSLLGWVLE